MRYADPSLRPGPLFLPIGALAGRLKELLLAERLGDDLGTEGGRKERREGGREGKHG